MKKLVPTTKAILAVKHRPLNEGELGQQSQRQGQLTNEEEDSDDSDDSDESEDSDDEECTGTMYT